MTDDDYSGEVLYRMSPCVFRIYVVDGWHVESRSLRLAWLKYEIARVLPRAMRPIVARPPFARVRRRR